MRWRTGHLDSLLEWGADLELPRVKPGNAPSLVENAIRALLGAMDEGTV
jgi:hypothetical protein